MSFMSDPDGPTSYLFVDAAYLRKVFEATLGHFLGSKEEIVINWQLLKDKFQVERVFVYDSVADIKKASESDEKFKARVEAQMERMDSLNMREGFFVRLGSMRGDPKRTRQKEVDVLIAVDMLTHSHNRNMRRAILLAGDLDFKPVVEALVQQGTLVTVVSEPRTSSRELRSAGDRYVPMGIADLWTLTAFQGDFAGKFPNEGYQPVPFNLLNKNGVRGRAGGRMVHWYPDGDTHVVMVEPLGSEQRKTWTFHDKDKLDEFISLQYGELKWA